MNATLPLSAIEGLYQFFYTDEVETHARPASISTSPRLNTWAISGRPLRSPPWLSSSACFDTLPAAPPR